MCWAIPVPESCRLLPDGGIFTKGLFGNQTSVEVGLCKRK